MSGRLIVALDAMGGDHAPASVISGAGIARNRFPDVSFLIFGDERRIRPLLGADKALEDVCTVFHTEGAIAGDAKVAQALRTGRNSSMRLAIDAVADGRASCVVSAGNTGVLMAMAKIVLKSLPAIDRPAIASFFPTLKGESVMLDLGANVECTPENLAQFAVMGALFSRLVLGVMEPTIGLLNIGSEDIKGNETVRTAAQLLRTQPLPGRFHGFVEGDDIAAGTVDVVVTDGFTGNVALKTAEGTAKLYAEFLRRTFESSILARAGYLLARGAFKKLRHRTDPRRYNGAMFLGLQGVCVKSHGGTDAVGFANAIGVAVDLVRNGFNERIKTELEKLGPASMPSQEAAV
ncbi:MAG TPA: phosphate acyltransferase PlsX [Azospirillaceae bacterium]|nr:phosphate acyltransferase PlsX [Azospirillaceae bacterium]